MTMTPSSVSAEERNQIEQAVAAYCRGLDRFDRDIALSPFTPDAVLNYSGVYVGDAPGFMDWVWPFHERLELNIHRVANVFIDRNPSGDLVSESYVTSMLRRRQDDGFVDRVGYGRYVDRWAQADHGLAIAERDYVNDLITELRCPATEGSVAARAEGVSALIARRGQDDPSYRLFTAVALTGPTSKGVRR
jgi:hypothetical protein